MKKVLFTNTAYNLEELLQGLHKVQTLYPALLARPVTPDEIVINKTTVRFVRETLTDGSNVYNLEVEVTK